MTAMLVGKVCQVRGPVVDVRFPSDQLPELLSAIRIRDEARGIDLIVEVAQHLGDDTVRCIAMDSTDGLARGMDAEATGEPIRVPVGRGGIPIDVFYATGPAPEGLWLPDQGVPPYRGRG